MLWSWRNYQRLSRSPSLRTYLWEIPAPRIPRSLHPSPRHTARALGQRAPKPVIRSWLGGRFNDPPPYPLTIPLDIQLAIG